MKMVTDIKYFLFSLDEKLKLYGVIEEKNNIWGYSCYFFSGEKRYSSFDPKTWNKDGKGENFATFEEAHKALTDYEKNCLKSLKNGFYNIPENKY